MCSIFLGKALNPPPQKSVVSWRGTFGAQAAILPLGAGHSVMQLPRHSAVLVPSLSQPLVPSVGLLEVPLLGVTLPRHFRTAVL